MPCIRSAEDRSSKQQQHQQHHHHHHRLHSSAWVEGQRAGRSHEGPCVCQLPCGLSLRADLRMLRELAAPLEEAQPQYSLEYRWHPAAEEGQVNRLPFFINHFFDTYLLISEDTPVDETPWVLEATWPWDVQKVAVDLRMGQALWVQGTDSSGQAESEAEAACQGLALHLPAEGVGLEMRL
ncbi:Cadherin-23 [Fukomys damarensis]|uniref:Cadherin-23 n=1 Tax=Fukomys damarensis TaxID=885580 RepID=A0A091EMV3_FUKDA|nr:Cadherin-23 [Fukomys damarensis]